MHSHAWNRLLALAAALVVTAAEAEPAAEAEAAPAAAAPAAALSADTTPPPSRAYPWAKVLASGAGAALVSVPATLALSTWIGAQPSDLLPAALPSLLLFAAVPPLTVSLAEWGAAHWLAPGTARFGASAWVTTGVHLAVMTGAILLGASGHDLGDVALLTGLEMLLLPAVSALFIRAPSHRSPGHAEAPGDAPAAADPSSRTGIADPTRRPEPPLTLPPPGAGAQRPPALPPGPVGTGLAASGPTGAAVLVPLVAFAF